MSVHIGAQQGQIAQTILLPGDPLRAKFIAENYFKDPICFNEVRGMLGYTGTHNGKKVSVMGTGMGMPSHGIYVHELIHQYGVKNLIRVGSCGSLQKDIKIRDVILAMSASTDSGLIPQRFGSGTFAPTASWELLSKAKAQADDLGIDTHVGGILSTDWFYGDDPDGWKDWAKYGIMAVEMEAAALYTIAAQAGVNALAILTVSDSLVTGEATTSEERQKTFTQMMEIALGLA